MDAKVSMLQICHRKTLQNMVYSACISAMVNKVGLYINKIFKLTSQFKNKTEEQIEF